MKKTGRNVGRMACAWMVIGLAVFGVAMPAQAQTPHDVVEYYHLDAVGSVRAVTDANGAVVARHEFFPFGEGDGTAAGQAAIRFTGKERDAESGLDYFGARYYASRSGRFTTVDPAIDIESSIRVPQHWNRYAYVANNPLRWTDPDGRCTEVLTCTWAFGAAGAVVGGPVGGIVAGAAGALVGGAIVVGTWAILHTPPSTTTEAVGSSVIQTENRPGTLGKPDHRATVEEEAARIAGTPEVRVDTPGGKKGSRRADAARLNPDTGASEEIVQVYRPTPAGNIPKREKDAARDIERATGVKPTMVPVRPLPPKKPHEPEIQ